MYVRKYNIHGNHHENEKKQVEPKYFIKGTTRCIIQWNIHPE